MSDVGMNVTALSDAQWPTIVLMTEGLEAHLIELELRLQASTTRKDAAALAELLSEDFREFGPSGHVWNRASIRAAYREPCGRC